MLLDLGQDNFSERDLSLLHQEFLKFAVGNFVARFEATIVLRILLHGIVRQVHKLVVDVASCVFFARSAQVALLVDIAAQEARV